MEPKTPSFCSWEPRMGVWNLTSSCLPYCLLILTHRSSSLHCGLCSQCPLVRNYHTRHPNPQSKCTPSTTFPKEPLPTSPEQVKYPCVLLYPTFQSITALKWCFSYQPNDECLQGSEWVFLICVSPVLSRVFAVPGMQLMFVEERPRWHFYEHY